MQREITIATLGDLVDHGYSLPTWCNHCLANGPDADLPALIRQLGRGYSYIITPSPDGKGERNPLRGHLPCPDCLGELDFVVAPPAPVMGRAHAGHRPPLR